MLTDKCRQGGELIAQCDGAVWCTVELPTGTDNHEDALSFVVNDPAGWTVEIPSGKTFCSRHKPHRRHDDPVNSPAHYNIGKIEVIVAIEDWQLGFHEGNVVKYVARAKHKGNELIDLQKAKWYLERRIAELEATVRQDPLPKVRGYNEG